MRLFNPLTTRVSAGVEDIRDLYQPDRILWCNGSEEEDRRLRQLMVDSGAAIRLNEKKRPNRLLVRSDPRRNAPSSAAG